jgi:hypothetical protein
MDCLLKTIRLLPSSTWQYFLEIRRLWIISGDGEPTPAKRF